MGSVCTGAGLLLLLLPLNGVLMSRLGNLQTTLMEHKDTRLDMVTQILANIKVSCAFRDGLCRVVWLSGLGCSLSRCFYVCRLSLPTFPALPSLLMCLPPPPPFLPPSPLSLSMCVRP